MVYGVFALFFDVLMIPFLRDFTSLEKPVRIFASKVGHYHLLDSVFGTVVPGIFRWTGASGTVVGGDSVTERKDHPSQ